MATQLKVVDGDLYIPADPKNESIDPFDIRDWPLMITYPAGDCDRIQWPFESPEWEGKLAHALYDAREMGLIQNANFVLLPDGTEFVIEDNLGKYKPESMEGIWY